MQRRVWVENRQGVIYANLYVLLVAPPGVGKSETIKRVGELWRATENLHVAPNTVTRAALLDVLARSSVKSILPTGEFQLFHGLNVAASEFGVLCPAHDLEFLNTLNDIFDNPPDFSEERRHRKGEQVDIKEPIMNIIGGTQPGFLSELMPETAWSMGFASRLLMIYSATPVKVNLENLGDSFLDQEARKIYEQKKETLKKDLSTITTLHGAITWSEEAAAGLKAWYKADLAPVPTHSRMQHYNTRRLLNIFKLSMVSSISRSSDLVISSEDLTRAQDWLLEAEEKMPDIFRDMAGKSDKQVVDDLHDYMWRAYARDRKPIHESRLIAFLQSKVPTEKVLRIIELCERAGIIERDRSTAYPLWKPATKDHNKGIE